MKASGTTLQPLDQAHHDLLTAIAHETTNLFTNRRDGRWATVNSRHQRLVETLGARALLTTVPVAHDSREWVLTRLGQRVHNSNCARCTAGLVNA